MTSTALRSAASRDVRATSEVFTSADTEEPVDTVRCVDLTGPADGTVEEPVEQTVAGPNHLMIYSSSIFATLLLFLGGVSVPASMVYGNPTGWALGAFCAFWGGPSFGVMVGSARVSSWYDRNGGHE